MLNTLNFVFENPRIDANSKVVMLAFYTLKRREEMLGSKTALGSHCQAMEYNYVLCQFSQSPICM